MFQPRVLMKTKVGIYEVSTIVTPDGVYETLVFNDVTRKSDVFPELSRRGRKVQPAVTWHMYAVASLMEEEPITE